jgi:hypothetical protein
MNWKKKAKRLLGNRSIHFQENGQFALVTPCRTCAFSLCQRERKPSKPRRASYPVDAIVTTLLFTILRTSERRPDHFPFSDRRPGAITATTAPIPLSQEKLCARFMQHTYTTRTRRNDTETHSNSHPVPRCTIPITVTFRITHRTDRRFLCCHTAVSIVRLTRLSHRRVPLSPSGRLYRSDYSIRPETHIVQTSHSPAHLARFYEGSPHWTYRITSM